MLTDFSKGTVAGIVSMVVCRFFLLMCCSCSLTLIFPDCNLIYAQEFPLVNTWRATSVAVTDSDVWSQSEVGTVVLGRNGAADYRFHEVGSLYQDRQGRVWQETSTGIRVWDNNAWVEYDLKTGSGEFVTEITAFLGSKSGKVWVAGARVNPGGSLLESVVMNIDSEGRHLFDLESRVGKGRVDVMLEDANGSIWMVGAESKFPGDEDVFAVQIKGDSSITYRKVDGLATTASVSTTVKAALSSEDDLWVSGYRGLSVFNGESWTTITRAPGTGRTLSDISKSLASGSDGTMYLSTHTTLFIVRKGEWYQTESKSTDNIDAIVTGIFADDEFGVIVGTLKGLRKIDNDTLAEIPEFSDLVGSAPLYTINQMANRIVVGTERGVLVYENGVWSIFRAANEPAHVTVVDVEFGLDGSIWLAHDQFLNMDFGVSRYKDGAWDVYDKTSGIPGNRVNSVHVDKSGAVWTAGSGGVGRFFENRWTTFTPVVPASRSVQAIDLCIDGQNKLWVAVEAEAFINVQGSGDSLFRDTTWLLCYHDGQWTLYSEDIVGSISMLRNSPDGTVWGASQFGGSLLHIDDFQFSKVRLEDSFDDDVDVYPREVNDIAVGGSGQVFVCYATQRATPERNPGGISIYDNGSWTHIKRGVIDESFELGSIAVGHSGEIIATNYLIGGKVYWRNNLGWQSRQYSLGRFPQFSSVALDSKGQVVVGTSNSGAILYQNLVTSAIDSTWVHNNVFSGRPLTKIAKVGDDLTVNVKGHVDHAASIDLVAVDGRMFTTPVLKEQTLAGFTYLTISTRMLSPGLYFATVTSTTAQICVKILLLE